LAGLTDQVAGDVRSGTPAYMSPEQLAGREVTIKSDIYALGLLLYEVFTGRRAFEASSLMELMRMQEQAAPASLSSVVKELDPAVERIIMRCLQPDPRARPASALAVAAGLPGGDPVAAALAAGETPSPDLLAAAGETEGLQPRFALACLGLVFALLAVCVWLGTRNSVVERSALDKPPEVLVGDAIRVIGQAGYTAKPVDSAFSFTYEGDFRKYLKQHPLEAKEYWSNLADRRPGLIQLWYRQSPRYLVPRGVVLTMEDPPEEVVGMVGVRLDARGRLISFRAVPPEIEKSVSPPKPFDWSAFFAAAGLDMKRFQPAEPEWLPPFAFDQRVAWMGGSEQASAPLRAEGASWNGRPIFFRVIGPWSHPYRMTELRPTAGERTGQIATLFVIYAAILSACVIARFHFGKGRVDRRGALRMALTCYVAFFVPGMLRAHHVAAIEELGRFWLVAGMAAINPVVIWVVYLAIEPWVRRRWPRLMIGWNRLMAAGWRDPLVGRDVLYGLIAGAVMGAGSQMAIALRPASAEPFLPRLSPLMGLRWSVASTGDGLASGITSCLIFMFVLVLFRSVLRRSWMAGAAMTVAMAILFSLVEFTPARVGANLIFFGMFSLTLLRFGMLAALAAMTAEEMLDVAPLTFDLSTWYGAQVSLTLVVLAVAAALAFRVSLGGRKLLGDDSF
jgi:serine/threonine-protein kinase